MATRRAGGRTGGVALGLVALTAASVAAALAWSAIGRDAEPALTPMAANVVARMADAAAADAGAAWRARFRDELARDYRPAEVRHFVAAAPDACAGGAATAGPFYCAETRALSLDLATLHGVAARMRRDGELAVALFVGRAAAAQPQAELGLAAPAAGDCLAGVWAAGSRLAGVTADIYARTLAAASDSLRAVAPRAAARDAALFAPGAEGARRAAFARGLAAGEISACAAVTVQGRSRASGR